MSYAITCHEIPRPALVCVRAAAAARAALEADLGQSLPAPGSVALVTHSGWSVFALGPDEWLVRTAIENEQDCMEHLHSVMRNHHAAVIRVSDAYVCFRLAGRDVIEVLAQAIAIDLRAGAFGPGSVTRCAFAKVSAVIHHLDPAGGFDIHVDSTVAAYVEGFVRAAACMRQKHG